MHMLTILAFLAAAVSAVSCAPSPEISPRIVIIDHPSYSTDEVDYDIAVLVLDELPLDKITIKAIALPQQGAVVPV